jgi:diguanylate cyclase (GGDEF)-like protein
MKRIDSPKVFSRSADKRDDMRLTISECDPTASDRLRITEAAPVHSSSNKEQLNDTGHAGAMDYLTGLASRARFDSEVQQRLAQVRDGVLQGICVLFLDLDRFKRVNDTLGHAIGDDLLKLVSDRILGEVDSEDTVARLGGDEFAILLPSAPNKEALSRLGQRLVDLVQRTYLIEGHVVHVGSSIGIALAPEHGSTSKELLRRADLALYDAKAAGRGTFRYFTPELETRAQDRHALETDIRKALVLRQLVLFYQPQLNVETGQVTGLEALLRWKHPRQGLLLPQDFMPLAEEIGMMVPIGEWVLKTICAEAKKWPDELAFAMNVSSQQFEDPGLVSSIERALARTGITGSRLEVEVTEDILLRNSPCVPGTLNALRQLGVRVTLDDFGTGVASLSHLARLPFDKIKIDRSLVTLQRSDPKNRAIVRAISALGQSLGISTHAEGVESPEHLEQVRSDGCRTVQGFYYSEAVPADKLVALLNNLSNSKTDEQVEVIHEH